MSSRGSRGRGSSISRISRRIGISRSGSSSIIDNCGSRLGLLLKLAVISVIVVVSSRMYYLSHLEEE